jgi:hypothetical protein
MHSSRRQKAARLSANVRHIRKFMSTPIDIAGFKFIEVGIFYVSDEPLEAKYNGKNTLASVCIKLRHDTFKKVGESAYILFVDEDLVYVGEYSYNLEDRWLKKGKYVWHHKDNDILKALKENRRVTLWLSMNPYITIENGNSINISKSIEQEILKRLPLPWNVRGKLNKNEKWIEQNCIKFSEIMDDTD